ncbi:hypothetical protein E2C01_041936 [Portunus trituberculatus]|uniref:Uncharacterized protein n=1 Tax=Portunus trituberculatus TaxID=210409 RepID=A0A5B7FT78_PORTR|nr:hypothetical protein [Portunus trituberculatus]
MFITHIGPPVSHYFYDVVAGRNLKHWSPSCSLFTEHKTNNAADSTVSAVTRTQRCVFLFSCPSPPLVRRQHMQGVPRTRKGPQFAHTKSLCSIPSSVNPLRHGRRGFTDFAR